MDMVSFFQKANIFLTPLLSIATIVNTSILVWGHVTDKFFKDDNFELKVSKNGDMTIFNKGKYNISITEVALWVDGENGGEPKIENMHPQEIRIIGRDKKTFHISLGTREVDEIIKKYEKVYLCFDIKSDSGNVYEQLVYKIRNKNGSLKFGKSPLKKDLCYFL